MNASAGDTITGVESSVTVPYIDSITVTEGTNYFHVRPQSGVGVWGEEKVFIIKYDKTSPVVVSVAEDDADDYVTESDTVNIDGTVTETGSGINTCHAYWDDNTSYGGGETDLGDLGTDCDSPPSVTVPNSTDDTRYFCIRPVDNAGLSGYGCTDPVTYDETGPTGSITNASGNPTNDDTPTLNLTIADAGIGTSGAQMRFSCDNATWSTWETYATPKTNFDIKPASTTYGCSTADGSKTVYVIYRDSLLNEGSSYNTGAFTLDTAAPTGGSFVVNSDDAYTASQTGNTLNVTCPTDGWATVQMAYGNSASPTNWTTCAATVSSYDLGAGDGTKTVYMRFRDGGLNTTSDTTDTITLDTATPNIVEVYAGPSDLDRFSLTDNVWFNYVATGSDDQLSFSWTDPDSLSDDTF